MNKKTAKAVRRYLASCEVDLNTPEGKRLYRNVKRKMHEQTKATMAGEEKSEVSK